MRKQAQREGVTCPGSHINVQRPPPLEGCSPDQAVLGEQVAGRWPHRPEWTCLTSAEQPGPRHKSAARHPGPRGLGTEAAGAGHAPQEGPEQRWLLAALQLSRLTPHLGHHVQSTAPTSSVCEGHSNSAVMRRILKFTG